MPELFEEILTSYKSTQNFAKYYADSTLVKRNMKSSSFFS